MLGEILEGAPELLPARFGWAADEDVSAFGGFFVDDAEEVCVLGGEAAGTKVGFDEGERESDDDQSFWRRVTVTAFP